MNTVTRRIGKYELLECSQRHAASEVWKAYDQQTQRPVSITLFVTDTNHDRDYILRFTHEAGMLSSLHHPNIASIQDAGVLPAPGSDSMLAYLVTDALEGPTLASYIRTIPHTGKLPVAIVHIFAFMAMAIDYAHQHGVMLGSLKPSSVILRRSAAGANPTLEPIMTDIGIPRLLGAASGIAPRRSLEEMLYISPEQARGRPVDARSDIYTLGVVLYEVCTGVTPFQGTRPVSLLMQHVSATPPSPSLINPNISPALASVIMRCLEKEPALRFATAMEMTSALAHAFNTSLPERFNYQVYPLEADALPGEVPFAKSLTPASVPVPPSSMYHGQQKTPPASAYSIQDITHIDAPSSSLMPLARRAKRAKARLGRVVLGFVLLAAIIVASLGTSALLHQRIPTSSAPIGSAFFLTSGQLNEHISDQGVNDELRVDLSSLPEPASGKSYYAWLLPDKSATEAPSILLGHLSPHNGSVHFLYTGGQSHTNLLAATSRFLITEEDAHTTPANPTLDTGT